MLSACRRLSSIIITTTKTIPKKHGSVGPSPFISEPSPKSNPVSVLLLSLLALGIIAAIAGIIRQWWLSLHRGTDGEISVVRSRPADCCGQHEVCEKESLLSAVSKDIEYYDDEELDRFARRSAEDYSAEEVEEFEEILSTLRSDEVAGWVRSLQLRSIELPIPLRDEVIMIVGERR